MKKHELEQDERAIIAERFFKLLDSMPGIGQEYVAYVVFTMCAGLLYEQLEYTDFEGLLEETKQLKIKTRYARPR